MKIDLTESTQAHINFAGHARVSVVGDSAEYNVRWFRRRKVSEDYDEIGRMDLTNGRWGAFPFEDIEQWKIEFWHGDEQQALFDNHLANKPVILIAKTKTNKVGKSVDFDKIKEYCTSKVNEFNCDLKVYFKESCKFDFTNLNFSPLRLNDNIPDMYYGLEKEF